MKVLRTSTLARTLAVCVPTAVAGALALTGVSYAGSSGVNCDPGQPEAGACTERFDNTFEIHDITPIDGCEAQYGTSAAIDGTGRERGGATYGGTNYRQFHFHVMESENVRITFPDGRYALRTDSMTFEYSSGTATDVLTLSNPFRGREEIFTADGQDTGESVVVHGITHFTWTDTNGNGDPDPGDDYRSSVDYFRMTCR
jgi:hypothetical protein